MPPSERDPTIDAFRGLAILGMVAANFLAGAHATPAWLRHARDVGFTVTDAVAPAFVLAMGLTMGAAFQRRWERDGALQASLHAVRRSLALLGLGCLFGAGGALPRGGGGDWGVLQALGTAGLVALPFLRAPAWGRVLAALGVLVVYQVLLDRVWLDSVLAQPHGGLQGSIAWGAMLLLATVVPEVRRRRWGVPVSGLVLVVGALALALLVPVSKHRVSASYVLLSTGTSALALAAVEAAVRAGAGLRWLRAWGRNPLLLYVLHLFVLTFVALPAARGWHAEAGWALLLGQLVVVLGLLQGVAWALEKRGVVIIL
ncbi:MAG: heparan-alpha-glucosaminide N-acetyltransferase domain-containing protein [Pseudomonadota bacterium]